MRTLAIITTLAIAGGTVGVAAAQPYQRHPDRVEYRHRYDRYNRGYIQRHHYNRFDRDRWVRGFRNPWVTLAYDYSGRSQRQFINLRGRGGRFSVLRIEGERGAPVINQIAIQYLDGDVQKVRLDARLPAGEGEVIQLDGRRRIQRVIVYTHPGYRGTYSLYGA